MSEVIAFSVECCDNCERPKYFPIGSKPQCTNENCICFNEGRDSATFKLFVRKEALTAAEDRIARLEKALLELGEELHDERCGAIFTPHEYDENCPQVKGYLKATEQKERGGG